MKLWLVVTYDESHIYVIRSMSDLTQGLEYEVSLAMCRLTFSNTTPRYRQFLHKNIGIINSDIVKEVGE